jgi:hypothetical protein
MSRRLPLLFLPLLAVVATSCSRPEAPAPALASTAATSAPTASAPALATAPLATDGAPAPSSAAPAPAASAPSGAGFQPSPVLAEFASVNHVDDILAAWTLEMHRQWNEQAAAMKVKPPEGFWEEGIATFDFEAERAALLQSVASGLSEQEMREDVSWMRGAGMLDLATRLLDLKNRMRPIEARLGAEARRAAERASGGRADSEPPLQPPPPSALPPAELAKVHRLMEELGYGAPAVLAPRLMTAVRETLPEAPAATWSDPRLVATAELVARHFEAAFLQQWSPAEAATIAAAIASPQGKRHDELMGRLTPLVMARSQPFTENLQKHQLRRYAKIFNAAWEERERLRAAEGSAPASPSAPR